MGNIEKENLSRILEAFAYIAERAPARKDNMYNVLKVFYLADKLHMERYGRFIFNDNYSAMRKGPVPAIAYDLIKDIKSGQKLPLELDAPVKVGPRYQVQPLRSADEDLFSGSDLLCIDEIIELSKTVDLGEYSHDNAWNETPLNRMIPVESILCTLQHGDALLDLHRNRHP